MFFCGFNDLRKRAIFIYGDCGNILFLICFFLMFWEGGLGRVPKPPFQERLADGKRPEKSASDGTNTQEQTWKLS